MMKSSDYRNGLTIVELLTVLAIIGILAALILPAVFGGRESARRATCGSNLHQVGLALAEYEATHRQYVPMRGGPLTNGDGLWMGGRISGLVSLSPHLDRPDIYNQVTFGFESTSPPRIKFARDGEPWWRGGNYAPWRTQLEVLRCPSDPGRSRLADWGSMGRSNFGFCMGDSQMGIELTYWDAVDKSVRGMFQQRFNMRPEDCTDGLGNTVALGEIATPISHLNGERTTGTSIRGYQATLVSQRTEGHGIIPRDCLAKATAGIYLKDQEVVAKRGMHWGDGCQNLIGFNTIVAPNSPSCISEMGEGPGILSITSYHMGGAHVLMLDGAIRFINDDIDTGDPNAESPGIFYEDGTTKFSLNWQSKSPYGVWGAMGSRNAGD